MPNKKTIELVLAYRKGLFLCHILNIKEKTSIILDTIEKQGITHLL
jgi:hypothetical protein